MFSSYTPSHYCLHLIWQIDVYEQGIIMGCHLCQNYASRWQFCFAAMSLGDDSFSETIIIYIKKIVEQAFCFTLIIPLIIPFTEAVADIIISEIVFYPIFYPDIISEIGGGGVIIIMCKASSLWFKNCCPEKHCLFWFKNLPWKAIPVCVIIVTGRKHEGDLRPEKNCCCEEKLPA